MQKTLSVMIAVAFLAIASPAVSANETVTEAYTGALGSSPGAAGMLFPNSDGSPFTQAGIRPIGGVNLNVENPWSNVIATPSDDVYGTGAAINLCFFNPDGDNICDGDDISSGPTCGTAAILNAAYPSDSAAVFVLTLRVSEDLDVCGGSTGSITGNFF